jgi:hypothetical protein
MGDLIDVFARAIRLTSQRGIRDYRNKFLSANASKAIRQASIGAALHASRVTLPP